MVTSKESKLRCCVCDKEKSSFICAKCICKGDFTSSKFGYNCSLSSTDKLHCLDIGEPNIKEKFREKKAKLWSLEEEQKRINEKLTLLLAEKKQLEAIEQTIAEYEVKIAAMHKMINQRKNEKLKSQEYSKRLSRTKEILKSNQDKCKTDFESTGKTIAQVKIRIKHADAECEKLLSKIKQSTKESISQLNEYIFPFKVDNSFVTSSPIDNSLGESPLTSIDQSVNRLSTATTPMNTEESEAEHSFSTGCPPSMGSWSNVEQPLNQRYHIVDSWIPRDLVTRSYCSYWAAPHEQDTNYKPSSTDSEIKTRDNDAYRVSAALSYITQLITVVSHYTETRFPKKLSYVEFYSKYSDSGSEVILTNDQLLHKVAKLNANLIYLCLSQQVCPDLLEPTMTGYNLSLLLNTGHSDLGTIGPVIIDSETHRKIEQALYPDYALVDQQDNQDYFVYDSYEDDLIGNDWESIASSCSTITPSYYMENYNQQTMSMTSGIMSSIAETAFNAVTSFIRKK